jgi:hypothetical protein
LALEILGLIVTVYLAVPTTDEYKVFIFDVGSSDVNAYSHILKERKIILYTLTVLWL